MGRGKSLEFQDYSCDNFFMKEMNMTDSLRTRLTDDLKTAMKAGERARVDTIRLIISKMKEADVNARAAGKELAQDADLLPMLQTMVKQRNESAKIFRDNARVDLAEKEEGEIVIIQGYLPAQLSDDAVAAAIGAIIVEIGAAGPKDMGRVMAVVKERLTGQCDMGKVSGVVKVKLG